jgi:hypothetical protein
VRIMRSRLYPLIEVLAPSHPREDYLIRGFHEPDHEAQQGPYGSDMLTESMEVAH